jgi:hypothetical protein
VVEFDRQRHQWHDEQHKQHAMWEKQQRELDREREALSALRTELQDQLAQQRVATRQTQQAATLHRELVQWRVALREREAALELERRIWQGEHDHVCQRTASQRQTIAQHWRVHRQAIQMQYLELRQRREQLDRRQQALEQRQSELQRARDALHAQRIALQITRQDGSQEPDAVEPSTVIREHLRALLAEQKSAQEAACQQQKQELQQLAASLVRQQESLKRHHAALHGWASRLRQAFDEQASQAVAQALATVDGRDASATS